MTWIEAEHGWSDYPVRSIERDPYKDDGGES